MFRFNRYSALHSLFTQLVILNIIISCFGATFNAKTQFSWVDSSCDSVIDKVNDAGDDYNALVNAAITNLDGGSPTTDLGKGTLLAFFGTEVGQLINSRYGRLKSAFGAQPIALGLYCDGSAFEWVTQYQEGPQKGQDLPNGGQWHAKEGRYNPAEGPLYLAGQKTDQRTNICQTPQGQNAQGVSSIGGKHIILCPDAFNAPVLGAVPTGEQTIGTSLDTLTSTGAVLLHEATHCILSTKDTLSGYKINGVLLTAKISTNAQKNADTWMYYAMASLANKNAWVVGLAQALDNFGPNAPKAPSTRKRNSVPLDARKALAGPDDEFTNLHAIPGPAFLRARTAIPVNSITGNSFVTTGLTGTGFVSSLLNASYTARSESSSTAPSSGHSGTISDRLTATGQTGTSSNKTALTNSASTGVGPTGSGSSGAGFSGSSSVVGTASTSFKSQAQTASSGTGLSSHTDTASGFTTLVSNPGTSSGGPLGPMPNSAQSVSLTAAAASQSSANFIGLTTITGTTTPTPVTISSSASSNGHTQKTNGVGPFPIFGSHSCWFCPPGLCDSCGIELDLPKGIYPPGAINPPPDWKGPLPTITVGDDGTPSYDEDKPTETNNQPSSTHNSDASSAISRSSVSTATPSASSTVSSATSAVSSTVSTATSSASSSSVNYIFETPDLYSEVSDTIPYESVSAVVASEFAANSIPIDGGATSTGTSISATSSQKSQPASTAFSSQPVSTTSSSPDRTSATPSTTPAPSSSALPAFSCSTLTNPIDPDYSCLCQGFTYCSSNGGGCGWTTTPAAENCCLDCM